MKKITFILGSMGRGGAERVISILSDYYAQKGYQTDIIVLLKNEVGYRLHETTRIIDFSGKTMSRLKRVPFWIKSIKKYVKENKPDVIISFAARINVITLYACKKLKTKIIVSERNDPRLDGRSKLVDFMTNRLYPKADKVVFQTQRAKSYFKKLKNGLIIPNPIRVPVFAEKVNVSKIVTVGRLTQQKNQKMLISAFCDLAKKNPDAFLEIYGAGELEGELKQQTQSLDLQDKIKFMGNRENVLEMISDASMFCLSSDYEGLSNALLEAMMMGIPCVSTKCAGADEYIIDGENGFLVAVGDKENFAEKMTVLYNNVELQRQFSEKSKETAVAFSMEAVMKKWDEIVEG